MNGRPWTSAEKRRLRKLYPNTSTKAIAEELGHPVSSVYGMATKLGLTKSDEYLASPAACRLRRGDNVGKSTRFQKGIRPWNTGMKGLQPGGRAKETQFKKGHRPKTWVPIGTEVVTRDGYLKRKVRDDAERGMSRRNWKFVHVLLWEEQNGPVPDGHAVVFKNGDRSDIRIENLDLINRCDLMSRNTIARFPPELRKTIHAVAKLRRTIEAAHEEQD